MDKKELNKLIEEVLLQEFKVKITGAPEIDIPNFRANNKSKLKPVFDPVPSAGDIKALAGEEPDSNELTDDDLETAFKKDRGIQRKVADLIRKTGAATYKKAAQDAFVKVGATEFDPLAGGSKAEPVKQIQPSNTGLGVDDRSGLKPFGSLAPMGGVSTKDSSLGDTFSPGSVDSSLLAIIDTLNGKNMIDKLKDLDKLNDYYTDPIKLKSITTAETLRLAAATPMITALAQCAKEYDASAAGFVFEKITAALCYGLQVGAGNGATDVLNAMKNPGSSTGQVVRYSMKLLADTSLTQSWYGAKDDGLWHTLSKGPLYYIFGHKSKESGATPDMKQGDPENYQSIYFYCIRVELGAKARETGPFDVDLAVLKADGSWSSIISKQAADYDLDKDNKKQFKSGTRLPKLKKRPLWNDSFRTEPFARIQAVPSSEISSGAPAVAKRVQSAVDAGYNEMLSQISKAYRLLQNMERTTQEYTAKQSQNMSSPNAQLKYVSQIGKDYNSTRENFVKIFQGVDKASGPSPDTQEKTFTDYASGLKKESKTPLDQLIEAIIKQKLLK